MDKGYRGVKNLMKLQSEWTTMSRKILKGYDITYPQFRVLSGLMELQEPGKRITQAHLSQYTGIDVMTLSTIIRNLESRRLIRRAESRSDTRAKNVYLTSVGLSLAEDMVPAVEQAAQYFFASYSDDLLEELCKVEACFNP
ncbi:MarR family transcriptional regulator [Macrococcus hajekii]|uniref:MarR family transcriptional regulator n=1 Tax=Macrococcus hajekii TaxID=198482 RepID=A0A4R6BN46_9STAP|nr:MarR family transcriptional regulator [Macrococcus hajekii]TDM03107.1 MarR family transcriptional regulator [Macrococcus hajekii]GGA96014.1 hypothetical protein GCM10007190_00070 [Macrococcus hajekii]